MVRTPVHAQFSSFHLLILFPAPFEATMSNCTVRLWAIFKHAFVCIKASIFLSCQLGFLPSRPLIPLLSYITPVAMDRRHSQANKRVWVRIPIQKGLCSHIFICYTLQQPEKEWQNALWERWILLPNSKDVKSCKLAVLLQPL